MARKPKIIINSYDEVMCKLSSKIGNHVTISVNDLFDAAFEELEEKRKMMDNQSIWEQWEALIDDVKDKSSKNSVSVRSHGRNGNGNDKLIEILESVFERHFKIDASNNTLPKRIMKQYYKNFDYQNYQTSHIFEQRTNNPFLFGAPWMVCLCPKILDPFTGHESRGVNELTGRFIDWAYKTNKEFIEEYNEIIISYWKRLKQYVFSYNSQDSNNSQISKTDFDNFIVALAPIDIDLEKLSKSEWKKGYLKKFENLKI